MTGSEHLRVIQSAVSSFTDHTCIRFEPRKGEKKYLSIENGLGYVLLRRIEVVQVIVSSIIANKTRLFGITIIIF